AAGIAILPAFVPRLAHLDAASPAARLPRPTGAMSDEAYWRGIRAQFPIREGFVPMNAANLCPAPRSVFDAFTAAMRDEDADVSFQSRAKFDTARETVRGRLARYLGVTDEEIAIVRNTS